MRLAAAHWHDELHMRRGQSSDGREIAFARLERPTVLGVVYRGGSMWDVMLLMAMMSMLEWVWRSLGRSTGDVNDNGIVYRLAPGVEIFQGAAHVLVRLQQAVFLVARVEAKMQVGSVKRLAERVGVLAKNDVADIIDEVILGDGNECRRCIGASDPDLPRIHHGGR